MELKKVAQKIRTAGYLVALTGAGISADSGLPIFRGKNGIWNKIDPDKVATIEAFEKYPERFWKFHIQMLSLVLKAVPNAGHKALAELETLGFLKLLITQNVDDLHERAGSQKIVKLHGDIWTVICPKCGFMDRLSEVPTQIPPRCPECENILKPNVVLFGELLPPDAITEAISACKKADLILVIGTSGSVMPAGSLPLIVKNHGGEIIEINTEPSAITKFADMFIQGRAANILPKILKELKESNS